MKRRTGDKGQQSRQSVFHLPLSNLTSHLELVTQDLTNYAHSVTNAFSSGARVANSFYALFKDTQFVGIAKHYSEISDDLGRAAEGYINGMTRDVTKDSASILAKVKREDTSSHDSVEMKSVAGIFQTFLQMQAQIYTSAFEVMSIFAKAHNNLDDLRDQESKQGIIQEYTMQSLDKLRLPDSNTTSMAIQTDPIRKPTNKASQFLNRLSNKNATNDSVPKSFFYCDLPAEGPVDGASSTEQTANVLPLNEGQDNSSRSSVETHGDGKQHMPMVTQQELDTVINLLAGPKRASRKMQTIPELFSPDSPPKPSHGFIAAPGGTNRTPDGSTNCAQFNMPRDTSLQNITYMGYPMQNQPNMRGYPISTENVPRVNIQAATPPGNIGPQEINHFPRLYRPDVTVVSPMSDMYGPPMHPQVEAEFAQYLASIGALTSGSANSRPSNQNPESLNKSWPRRINKGWSHLKDDTTSSESDSDGEQLLALGMGLANAITDQRRHSSDDTAVPGVPPAMEYTDQRHLASRSAEDLSRGYASSKTWPPKQIWNRHILPDPMLSMGTNEIFGGNVYQPLTWSMQQQQQQQPPVPPIPHMQSTWYTQGQTLAPDFHQHRPGMMNFVTMPNENHK